MKSYGVTLRPTVPGISELVQLARETEDAGFSGVYIPEAVNDALMCSLRRGERDQADRHRDLDRQYLSARARAYARSPPRWCRRLRKGVSSWASA